MSMNKYIYWGITNMKIYYYSMATGYKWKEYINPQSGKKKNRLLILIQLFEK